MPLLMLCPSTGPTIPDTESDRLLKEASITTEKDAPYDVFGMPTFATNNFLEASNEKPQTNLDTINPETNKELNKVDSTTTESNNGYVNYGQLGARPKTGSLISTTGYPLAVSDKHSSVWEIFDEIPESTPIIAKDAPFDVFRMAREAESYLIEQQKGFDVLEKDFATFKPILPIDINSQVGNMLDVNVTLALDPSRFKVCTTIFSKF